MYASMLTLTILHGFCNAFYLELSLHVTELCNSVLLMCIDPPIREVQLNRLFSPSLIPSMKWPHWIPCVPCTYQAFHLIIASPLSVLHNVSICNLLTLHYPLGFTPTRGRSVRSYTAICIPYPVFASVSSCHYYCS